MANNPWYTSGELGKLNNGLSREADHFRQGMESEPQLEKPDRFSLTQPFFEWHSLSQPWERDVKLMALCE